MKKIVEVSELTYEQALAELEVVVEALENGQQSLEESMALFERGQTLAQRCGVLLDQADLKVRQLTGGAAENGTEE